MKLIFSIHSTGLKSIVGHGSLISILKKTKVVVFGARKTNSFHFKLGDQNIEITDRYKYLGIYFSQSRSFLNARKHIAEQAKKAMHFLFCRINNLNLPIDLQLKLFDHTVVPILTYSCELWGYENLDMIERIHTDFYAKSQKLGKAPPYTCCTRSLDASHSIL